MRSRAWSSAWPTPATFPWPKIVSTPPNNGCSTPSRLVCCCVRHSISACAMVRRLVWVMDGLAISSHGLRWLERCRRHPGRLGPRARTAMSAQLVAARLTDPQRRLEGDDPGRPPLRRGGRRLDRVDQQFRGTPADVVLRKINGREAGREGIEPRMVVTGDEADVVGAAQLILTQC